MEQAWKPWSQEHSEDLRWSLPASLCGIDQVSSPLWALSVNWRHQSFLLHSVIKISLEPGV